MKKLILASSSPYRKLLLQRLRLPFEVVSPQLPETRSGTETGQEMAGRLAVAKARAVAERYPEAVVIGSDQVAVLDEHLLGKPGSPDKACQQLSQCAGNLVVFYTGLCVVSENSQQDAVESFQVHFRPLSDLEIRRYVELEQPLDCAGSFKCEGLGSVLFERLSGDDPTTLQGLPLIRLASMLRAAGLDPLA